MSELLIGASEVTVAPPPAWRKVNPHLFTVAVTALAVGVLPVIDRMDSETGPACAAARVSVAVAGLATCHVMAALVSARLDKKWPTWVFAVMLAANQPLLMAGSGLYYYECYGPNGTKATGYDQIAKPKYGVPTTAIWIVASVAIVNVVDTSAVWFWRAKDVAFIVFEFFEFLHAEGTLEVTGATGIGLVVIAAVLASIAIARASPVPRIDGAWRVGVMAVIGGRVAAGYHVHHAEWPLYAAVLVRHSPWAAGAFIGWSLQETSGPHAWRIWAWQR